MGVPLFWVYFFDKLGTLGPDLEEHWKTLCSFLVTLAGMQEGSLETDELHIKWQPMAALPDRIEA